ncbi:murein DD-endopeptidase MepM/ murein hydrolase activator NlpD [Paraburkholderia bannensis]|uniref:Murein DD-endopeptidase MepM/ murein hydrolase activator NlpD n=1 Tax=Paraburkholderia bannensis TaxID=765414 RepID=A0A7W9U2Q4_9BURK|nr:MULTISPECIES: M23 family metallopeptidase [Paraburkholderia]MBB3260901.1 murein DD-endopeptidase MepM/ murein hydrolase activator NlpD [Paraburkholderia sp. WP4_3_2]MBB6105938.1 murein DD-endopeptidase MepM/ murein hydrolase activator NlpD [Paraburkholderia bannensis]
MKMPWTSSVDELSSGDTRFVTHRAARRTAICTACAVGVAALAGGVAIGRYSSVVDVPTGPGPEGVATHHYVVGEIGRMNASISLLDPRIARLSAQIAELREFDQRLRTQPQRGGAVVAPAAPGARSGDDDEEGPDEADHGHDAAAGAGARAGEGGPALAPRRCVEASASRTNARAVSGAVDCMAATLATLEQAVAQHEAAWQAFPGRRPTGTGRLGSPFGNRIDPFTQRLSFHPGLDIVAPTGTPILAAAGGRVVFAGPKAGYGNCVDIDHGNGFATRYGHASKIDVQVGQIVLPGDHIADVGSTGRSTGPHLHFEVIVSGTQVNPAGYLALFGAYHNG